MYAFCFSRNVGAWLQAYAWRGRPARVGLTRAGRPCHTQTVVCEQAPASRLRTVRLVAIFVFALCGVSVFGADDDSTVIFPAGTEQAQTKTAPKSGGFNAVTLVAALLLASAGGWFMWTKRRGSAGGRMSGALAVEETRPLGNRQYLVVASYEGKKFLLGVCPGQINMLAPLDEASVEESPHA